jgi:hypothetical protein
VAGVESSGRALPTSDHQAILGVLSIVQGYLMAGELPADLTDRLIDRLSRHGSLPEGASAGQLNLLLGDLAQRMHWAMSDEDTDYPGTSPLRNSFHLELPGDAVASCVQALTELNGENIRIEPGPTGTGPPCQPGRTVSLSGTRPTSPAAARSLWIFPNSRRTRRTASGWLSSTR